jgi:gamma-glutamyltranspeptidase
VTEVLLSRLVFGHDPRAAVSAPRFSVPTGNGTITVERDAPPALIADLERRGETVEKERFGAHAVQLIAREGDRFVPAADPRKHGAAVAQ